MEGSGTKQLAKSIMSSIYSTHNKEQMLQHLVDKKHPAYVQAQLDGLIGLVFVGFAPDPSTDLKDFITGTGIVTPRKEFPTEEKALHYISVMRQLRDVAATMQSLVHIHVYRETRFKERHLCRISWFDYFEDKVSLHVTVGGYNVIPRKELLYVRNRPSDARPTETERA